MKTVLLISNRQFDDKGGRSEKFKTRKKSLERNGWKVELSYVPNPFTLSVPRAIAYNTRLVYSNNIDVINAVSNPPQLQIVGLAVSELSGVPYLAEFRDPLVKNPEVDPTSVSGRLRAILESFIVRRADQIVWGDGIQVQDDYFDREYGDVATPKWYKLPYLGFDQSKFENAQSQTFDRFTITYAGSFYDGWIEPYAFLEGFQTFIDDQELSPSDVQFLVYGDWDETYTDAVKDLGILEFITTNDFIPHDDLIPHLKGSDVMLYIGGDDPRNRLSLPSKIWDYLGAGNPILAVVNPEFRSGQFVRDEGAGLVAAPSDPSTIAGHLADLYANKFELDNGIQEQFQRRRKMEEFEEILNLVADGGSKAGAWDDDTAGGSLPSL